MKSIKLVLCIFIASFFVNHTSAADISIVTGEIVPYSYKFEGHQIGVGSDIVAEISKRIGFEKKPASLPWPRALKYSLEDDTIIYPLARTKSRENQYLWIGPIVNDYLAFYVRADDKKTYNSIEDFKNLKIGASRGAPPSKRLAAMGFKDLDLVTAERNNALKLKKGRIDAWYATQLICEFNFRNEGFKQSDFRLAYRDVKLIFYLGASKNLGSEVQKWQSVLDDMKKDGTHKKILIKNHVTQ